MEEGGLVDSGKLCQLALLGDLEAIKNTHGGCKLQDVVNTWHAQPGAPAIASDARCIVLQLNRFRPHGHSVHKSKCPVALPVRINLPCWVEGSVRFLPFLVRAAVIHLGDSTRVGHYRSVLFEPSGRCWYTDDQVRAASPSLSDAKVFRENVYLIFLTPASPAAVL